MLAGLVAIILWGALAIYIALGGGWISSTITQGDNQAFFNWATNELASKNRGNSSLVLLAEGEVVHQYAAGAQDRVDADTLFPTASFSKWITALSVMSLVEKNLIELDAPVSQYLTRWKLPASEFDNTQVTIRRLLSHTAGLTDGLGFGDYGADEVIPKIEDELLNPRASGEDTVAIAVGIEPGTQFRYSGGGYLILQLVVEEVTGVSFVDFVQGTILEPASMSRSTYGNLAKTANVSVSYNFDGSIAPTFQYASAAATGFASSANDLSKLVKLMLSDVDNVVLRADTIKSMRKPHGVVFGADIRGLGTILYAPTANGDYVFGHDGANDPAINSTVRLNPQTSDGIVVLVSGHPTLGSNIGSEWVLWQTGSPDFLQTDRALRSAVVPFLLGGLVLALIVLVWLRRYSVRQKRLQ